MRVPFTRIIASIVLLLSLGFASARNAAAQQFNSAQREVWERVESRWRAWQTGDLEKMLSLYHPRFHAWNRATGRLDGHDSMRARWMAALQTETIVDVKLEPIALELYGDFATVFYVSRETVKTIPSASAVAPGSAASGEPTVVTIRWTDYLIRDGGRWLFVSYGGVPCSPSEPASSLCRTPTGK